MNNKNDIPLAALLKHEVVQKATTDVDRAAVKERRRWALNIHELQLAASNTALLGHSSGQLALLYVDIAPLALWHWQQSARERHAVRADVFVTRLTSVEGGYLNPPMGGQLFIGHAELQHMGVISGCPSNPVVCHHNTQQDMNKLPTPALRQLVLMQRRQHGPLVEYRALVDKRELVVFAWDLEWNDVWGTWQSGDGDWERLRQPKELNAVVTHERHKVLVVSDLFEEI